MKVLVCGGAGYIGSHTVDALLSKGYEVLVVDNLEKGHSQSVRGKAELLIGDLRDGAFIKQVFLERHPEAVIDFAAYSLVGESVQEPLKYYQNNLYATMNLLQAMKAGDVRHIVFSSTAATYGEPENIPIVETDQTKPTSPYGETKLAVEKMLKWCEKAYGIHFAALRYFNVAGAHIDGSIGEDHRPESHLIPNVLKIALGQKDKLSLFGDDYDTPDGTCVRDYIHVTDLANAHILALEKIVAANKSSIYNLGNGKGFSNKEIIDTAAQVTGKAIPYTVEARRPGDPSVLIASSQKITDELGWVPQYGALSKIIETAWVWHRNHPEGYQD